MLIAWLDEPAAQNEQLVGGKAAQLGRLAADFAVPPGFCLTTAAYEAWQQAQQDADGAAESFPPTLIDVISAAYQTLAQRCNSEQPAVAVRSSAVGEDGERASFAGQYQTVLNVRGVAALLAAATDCWRAATAPEVRAYRQAQGLPNDAPLALLVQQLVDADAALVAFSVDPVSGDSTQVVINACWGLGEPLVSGQITPDSFRVRKVDLTLCEQTIADKRWMRVASADGTDTVQLAAERANQPALNPDQVRAVAQLVIDLETQLGYAVDVECAYEQEKLVLLQCRPITTVGESANAQASSDPEPWHVSWNRPQEAELTWMGGHDLVNPLQQSISLYYYQGWAKAFAAVQAAGGLAARFVNGYEYRHWRFEPISSWEAVNEAQAETARQLPDRWRNQWLPAIQADLARWRAVDLPSLSDMALAGHLHEVLNRQLEHWEIHAHLGSVPLDTVQRLIDWYLTRFPAAPESEPYALLQGQHNVSVEGNHHLWVLSNEVNFAVAAALRSGKWSDLPDQFRSKFERYQAHFGDGTVEGRQRAAHLILSYVENEVIDPLVTQAKLADERQHFTAALRNRLADEELPHFEGLLTLALAHNPLTEDHNLYLDQQSDAVTKLICQEFGRRLTAYGILTQPDEVAFLTLHELLQWGFGLADPLRPRLAERKLTYARDRQLTPPPYLGKAPEPSSWINRFGGPDVPLAASPGTLAGVGASAGVVCGRARVVHTLEEAMALQPGEVLVCPLTNPKWTPLFALAAALVTDHGGSLAHAAVLAREYRLPAVVGTHRATQVIQNGQMIEVDGRNGVVQLVPIHRSENRPRI